MRRPWYSYLLLFIGILVLLDAVFRPIARAGAAGPGAVVRGAERRVTHVWEGSALDHVGVRVNDRFISGEMIESGGLGGELAWKEGNPRAGMVTLERGGEPLVLEVRPRPTSPGVRLVWLCLKLLNLALVALALALFWQRPRDGRAILLALVLLSAPVFVLPPGYRLWALALAAHFFSVFPAAAPGPRWRRAAALYGGFAAAAVLGSGLADGGNTAAALLLYHCSAIAFAGYSLFRVLRRWREPEPDGALIRTLAAAAGAILAAVLLSLLQRPWQTGSVSPLATLLPAALFSASMGHLVFRLRALEIRVVARRTLRYLLARWTLGTLFLIPGFALVYHLGELAGSGRSGRPQDFFIYLAWMFGIALLSGKRKEVLRNIDRRFFQDLEAARQRLIRLGQELGGQPSPEAVFATLETGVRQALAPAFLKFAVEGDPTPAATALSFSIRRGSAVHGYVHLGAKGSGLEYTAEERDLLEAAGAQAALALENARLSAALLERQRAELTGRTAGVLAGAEEERRRLAADLHDQVLPELRQIAGEFDRLRTHANGLEPDLDRLQGEVRGAMDSVREVMEALRPSALDVLGLADALESYFRKGAARCDPPLTVTVRQIGPEPDLAPDESLGLYRICQEAINNALKHSGAARAGLEVENGPEGLRLEIWDDGRGFALPAAADSGRGLGNIGYRADLIGARALWLGREGGGTRFVVRLPRASGSGLPADIPAKQ